jgi:hypothetical protein
METSREVDKVSDKIEQFFRDATADDVARVMRGEAVEARFRDSENTSWHLRGLRGWNTGAFVCNQDDWWEQCQVYDPPSWYVNKPDPGEGFRLLEKFPPEEKLATDEYWSRLNNDWYSIGFSDSDQHETFWYRRRIANTLETLNSPRSNDNIPSGWRLLGKDEERIASDAYWSLGCKDWIVIGDDRVAIANSQKWHAIRRVEHHVDYALVDEYIYHLPNGSYIRITAKGFEVQ